MRRIVEERIMWQLYGKGRSKAQLQAAHDVISRHTKVCRDCGKEKPLDNFTPGQPECKWCNTAYRVGLNDKTRAQADRNGLPWTLEEDDYIRVLVQEGKTDGEMALLLGRTMKSVRGHRVRALGISKRAKEAPKPVYDHFVWHVRPEIKVISVDVRITTIAVWSKSGVRQADIMKAFEAAGLTADDHKAWYIGVTAGA